LPLAAADEFAERCLDASVADIARRTGVGKGTVFRVDVERRRSPPPTAAGLAHPRGSGADDRVESLVEVRATD
jgi:hypothetical protein